MKIFDAVVPKSGMIYILMCFPKIHSQVIYILRHLGVVSHSLLQVRVTVANRKRLHNSQRNRKRRAAVGSRANRNKSTDVADDDSIVSED